GRRGRAPPARSRRRSTTSSRRPRARRRTTRRGTPTSAAARADGHRSRPTARPRARRARATRRAPCSPGSRRSRGAPRPPPRATVARARAPAASLPRASSQGAVFDELVGAQLASLGDDREGTGARGGDVVGRAAEGERLELVHPVLGLADPAGQVVLAVAAPLARALPAPAQDALALELRIVAAHAHQRRAHEDLEAEQGRDGVPG